MFLFQGESTYTLMWDGKDEWSGVLWDHTIFQVWFQKGHVPPAVDFLRNVEKAQREKREREKAVADQAANTAAVMLEDHNKHEEKERQRRLKRARVNANNAKAKGGFPGGGTL